MQLLLVGRCNAMRLDAKQHKNQKSNKSWDHYRDWFNSFVFILFLVLFLPSFQLVFLFFDFLLCSFSFRIFLINWSVPTLIHFHFCHLSSCCASLFFLAVHATVKSHQLIMLCTKFFKQRLLRSKDPFKKSGIAARGAIKCKLKFLNQNKKSWISG